MRVIRSLRRILLALDKNPEATFLVAACFIIGSLLLIRGPEPGSIATVFPYWFRLLWAAALLLGAGTRLVGIVSSQRLDAAGCALLASASFIYGLAVVVAVGWRGLVPIGMTFAFSGAQVRRFIRYVRNVPQ